jgi:hypothetical protein
MAKCIFNGAECAGKVKRIKGRTLGGFKTKRPLCEKHSDFKEVWEKK